MKKLSILFAMLVPMVLLSQGQPVASTVGFDGQKKFDVPSGNRSVPPGILVWSQLPVCDAAYACQFAANYPFDALAADDFLFAASPGQITAVRWWVIWYEAGYTPYVPPTSFNIFIYSDNSCIPGSPIATWNIPLADANEDAGCSTFYESREYWATLSPAFVPVPGQHYWITTQPVMDFPPQTMINSSTTLNLCGARQYFPEAGLPDWTDIGIDFAFELYAGEGPEPVPVPNWALLLGGILIAGAIFMRYRKLS